MDVGFGSGLDGGLAGELHGSGGSRSALISSSTMSSAKNCSVSDDSARRMPPSDLDSWVPALWHPMCSKGSYSSEIAWLSSEPQFHPLSTCYLLVKLPAVCDLHEISWGLGLRAATMVWPSSRPSTRSSSHPRSSPASPGFQSWLTYE